MEIDFTRNLYKLGNVRLNLIWFCLYSPQRHPKCPRAVCTREGSNIWCCLIITSHIIIIIVVIIIYLVIISVQASFFIAYVVTSGWASTSSELFRLIPLIWSLLRKPFSEPTTDEFEAPSFSYHWDIPRVLFFCLLGIIYFFLAPLILPFLLVYFCLGYIIYRNQVS